MELQLFTTQDGRSLAWEVFLKHPLGQMYQTIPFRELESLFPPASAVGRPGWFDVSGGIGLQILKHRYKCSDEKIIEQLNENKMMQFFCGIDLKPGEKIKKSDIVGVWRKYLGIHMNEQDFQCVCAGYWEELIPHKHLGMSDATCYESDIRYPTDAKLLWESCDWLWKKIKTISKSIKCPIPKINFGRQEKKQLNFQKRKRKTHKQIRSRIKSLLKFLDKLRKIMSQLIGRWVNSTAWDKEILAVRFFDRLKVIKTVYHQQLQHYKRPKDSIAQRIVSLAKPYIRPIVRGKERKRVEFGMKSHQHQVGGINLVELNSFEAFHEGNRLINSVWLHRRCFGQISQVAADRIYATNANRRYTKGDNIFTNWVKKGRAGKLEDQQIKLRKALDKERATRLEGSFGVQKNHYLLDRVKARTYHTERAWIFFGIFTANVTKMAKRNHDPPTKKAA